MLPIQQLKFILASMLKTPFISDYCYPLLLYLLIFVHIAQFFVGIL